MKECQACFCEYVKLVEYTPEGATDEWVTGVYCGHCVKTIQHMKWPELVKSVYDIDCLRSFRNIVGGGIPLQLTVNDMDMSGNTCLVKSLRWEYDEGVEIWSAKFDDVTITEEIRDEFVADLEKLVDEGEIHQDDVRTICSKYGLVPGDADSII